MTLPNYAIDLLLWSYLVALIAAVHKKKLGRIPAGILVSIWLYFLLSWYTAENYEKYTGMQSLPPPSAGYSPCNMGAGVQFENEVPDKFINNCAKCNPAFKGRPQNDFEYSSDADRLKCSGCKPGCSSWNMKDRIG